MSCYHHRNNVPVLYLILMFLTRRVVFSSTVCDTLPFLKNGQLLEDRQPPFAVNDYILFKCDEGFRSDLPTTKVTCVSDGNSANWTGTNDACKPVPKSCHYPGDIDNAERFGDVFIFPHNVTYVCKEGFKMKGSPTKYCSETGNWQPPGAPYCEAILCPPLLMPHNGEVQYNNRQLHSFATYKCNKNFQLVGNALRSCQADGNWNGSNPICKEITCDNPGPVKYGRIIGYIKEIYVASDIVIFQCDDGKHKTLKCLESGEWNSRAPVCTDTGIDTAKPTTDVPTTTAQVIICEDPGKIKNGQKTIIGLNINSTVIYSCDEGYELRGKGTLLCLDNGKWDLDKLPICVKPLSVQSIVGIVFGVIIFLILVVGGYLWYRFRVKSIRGYGKKSKALTADATDIEEITGLERDRKHIPVTVL